ncbi:MAG: hypothetical protein GXO40_00470 [Epsilonproteobacteria bacterium]|nr:hypothetical protein [Campylobacterota bacterium]
MIEFIRKRKEALKNPKIRGDIISNIGIGVFVNSLYSISFGGIDVVNFIDITISVIAIIEGSYLKERK